MMLSHKIEVTTGTVAAGAASSPFWLPNIKEVVSMAAHPIWAELLAPLGVLWLLIQIGFFLYDRSKRGKDDE
ncbi:MAG: hypothetical protein AAGB23_05165 [Pseudomonadota bacterium]